MSHDNDNMTSEQLRQHILNSSMDSFWLQSQMNDAQDRDVLDALNDAEIWLEYLQKRWAEMTAQVSWERKALLAAKTLSRLLALADLQELRLEVDNLVGAIHDECVASERGGES